MIMVRMAAPCLARWKGHDNRDVIVSPADPRPHSRTLPTVHFIAEPRAAQRAATTVTGDADAFTGEPL
jgi:hypothetical protein